ncbi:MAG TPA: S41 family peptidase [Lacunisphaera sp.]|nr:S41 family peptidase [Lacunisphaera sp.]
MNARIATTVWCALLASTLPAASTASVNPAIAPYLSDLREMLRNAEQFTNEHYVPNDRVGKPFRDKCRETEARLSGAGSLSEGYVLISDALLSVDPRIRFYPPRRPVILDWSWDWQLIGNTAYVCQVDHKGAARDQGLLRGDRILAIEGIPLNRETYQLAFHLLNTLLAVPGLHVEVQSPEGAPRVLAIPATQRERRRMRQLLQGGRIRLEEDRSEQAEARREEFFDVQSHIRRQGDVTIWKPLELYRDPSALNEAWRLIKGSTNLVVDLRGLLVRDHENVLHTAGYFFSHDVDLGRIDKELLDTKLRVKGRDDAFMGNLLVLVNAETAGYSELLAHAIQREQRGVIVGDRTMGRVLAEDFFQRSMGSSMGFTSFTVALPAGEVLLADGTRLDGKGVIPDFQVLPQPADLAGQRDVVLARALGLLKASLSAEDAYKLFPHYEDEDDEY